MYCFSSFPAVVTAAALADSSTLQSFDQVRGSVPTSGCMLNCPYERKMLNPFAPNGCVNADELSRAGQVKQVKHLPPLLIPCVWVWQQIQMPDNRYNTHISDWANNNQYWTGSKGQGRAEEDVSSFLDVLIHPLVQGRNTYGSAEEKTRRDIFRGSCSPHRQTLLCLSFSSCYLLCGCTSPFFIALRMRKTFFFHIPLRWNYFSNPLLQSRSL